MKVNSKAVSPTAVAILPNRVSQHTYKIEPAHYCAVLCLDCNSFTSFLFSIVDNGWHSAHYRC